MIQPRPNQQTNKRKRPVQDHAAHLDSTSCHLTHVGSEALIALAHPSGEPVALSAKAAKVSMTAPNGPRL